MSPSLNDSPRSNECLEGRRRREERNPPARCATIEAAARWQPAHLVALVIITSCVLAGCQEDRRSPSVRPPVTRASDADSKLDPTKLAGVWGAALRKNGVVWSSRSKASRRPADAARPRPDSNANSDAAPTVSPRLKIQLDFQPKHLQFADVVGCDCAIDYQEGPSGVSRFSRKSIYFQRDAEGRLESSNASFNCRLIKVEEDQLVAVVTIRDLDDSVVNLIEATVKLKREASVMQEQADDSATER